MARQAIVTLLSDFGTADPYVAEMKGALLNVCPRAQIIDICHDIPAHDILAGAFVLAEAAPFFPSETLHVAVVDPGVGTDRRILAGRFGDQIFLFPDNGIISFVAESMPLQAIVSVRNTNFMPTDAISMTFHGRDIFAPLAGKILNGLDIHKLGPQPETYKTLDLPAPVEQAGKIVGQVIYIDRFGNCISNISKRLVHSRWAENTRLEVRCGGRVIGPLVGAYDFVPQGEKLALFNSMQLVEVAVNRGRACDVLGAALGTAVEVVESAPAVK